MSDRRWATKSQAAEYAVVHPNTIDNWVVAGIVRAYKFGPRLVRYDLNEIDEVAAKVMPTAAIKPERVLSPSQTANFDRLVKRREGGADENDDDEPTGAVT